MQGLEIRDRGEFGVREQQQIDGSDTHVEPVVSVVIPHFNDLENLKQCLSCLRQQSMQRSLYEVIVADNNSSCGLAAVIDACKGVRVVAATKQGAGEARNSGVSAARGQFLAFTDSDCRPEPQWLEQGLRAMDGADVVGGRIVVSVDDREHLTMAESYELVFAFNNRRYVEEQGYSVTANMFTRRNVLDSVGPFRVGVSEDLDWGRRATALGFRVRYAIDAVVSHPARREWSDLTRKWRRLTMESYRLAVEQPHGKILWFLRSWLVLFSPIAHCRTILKSHELQGVNQRLKSIGAMIYLRGWRFLQSNRLLFVELRRD